MPDEAVSAYRPRNDDSPHVLLVFLTVSVFLLVGGMDAAVRPFTAIRPGQIHLACLAVAGLVGGSLVFEVRPVVLRARSLAALIFTICIAAILLRLTAWHYSAIGVACFALAALSAISAAIGMRGPAWRAYLAYVQQAGFTAF